MRRAAPGFNIFRQNSPNTLQLGQYIVTVREMQESQRFGSGMKVLFDTFSFKKKYNIHGNFTKSIPGLVYYII